MPVRIALMVAIAGTLPAIATRAEDVPPWVGVWRGSVGGAGVRLCIEDRDGPAGAYYYDRYLTMIGLFAPQDQPTRPRTAAVLHENLPQRATAAGATDAPDEVAEWTLRAAADGQSLDGSWRSPAKQLTVRLQRVAEPAARKGAGDDQPTPCDSDAFHKPREAPAKITAKAAKTDAGGTAYRLLSLDFGSRRFGRVEAFELLRDDPGARRLAEVMRRALVREQPRVFECARNESNQPNVQYDVAWLPQHIGRRWAVVLVRDGGYCGGAHPNSGIDYQIWNLATGQIVEPWTWFAPAGARVRWVGKGAKRRLDVGYSERLRALLQKAWRRARKGDADDFPGWWVYPTPKGLAFSPGGLGYANHANSFEHVTLPWQAVGPLLTVEGRQAAQDACADLAAPPEK